MELSSICVPLQLVYNEEWKTVQFFIFKVMFCLFIWIYLWSILSKSTCIQLKPITFSNVHAGIQVLFKKSSVWGQNLTSQIFRNEKKFNLWVHEFSFIYFSIVMDIVFWLITFPRRLLTNMNAKDNNNTYRKNGSLVSQQVKK